MSEFEANLPGLEINDEPAAKKATKKAARKTATKKAARKSATKKTARKSAAETTGSDAAESPAAVAKSAPEAESSARASRSAARSEAAAATDSATAAADKPRRTERQQPERAEYTERAPRQSDGDAPYSASPSRQSRDSRQDRDEASERPASRRPAPRRNDEERDIPSAFSASPDDIDDYGDVRARNQRERAERQQQERAERQNRDTDGQRDNRDADERSAETGGNQPRDNQQRDSRSPRDARDVRDNRDFRDNQRDNRDNRDGQRRPYRDNRDGQGDSQRSGAEADGDFRREDKPYYRNRTEGAEGAEAGSDPRDDRDNRDGQRPYRDGPRPQGGYNKNGNGNGNGQGGNAQGGGNGGQPFGKKQHYQKGQGGVEGNPKFQKFQKFKKGDKFNPQGQGGVGQQAGGQPYAGAPAGGPAQHAGKKAKLPHPSKIKGGKKSSWHSQFAAASEEDTQPPVFDSLLDDELFRSPELLAAKIAEITTVTTVAAATDADTAAAGAEATGEAAASTDAPATGEAASAGTTEAAAAGAAAPSASTAEAVAQATKASGVFDYEAAYALKLPELETLARESGIEWEGAPQRRRLLEKLLEKAAADKRSIRVRGLVELLEDGFGFVVFGEDNYRLRSDSPFLSPALINRYGLQRGHEIEGLLHPAREGETTPFVLRVDTVMGKTPEEIQSLTPFKELTPYYPTERILLESEQGALGKWDNISMRIVDLLSPVGLGQRGLIVAPPRTGKTVLMQGIANAIRVNRPEARLIILLVDERPEEVTDFRRSVKGAQVVSSTFDEAAESHVHAAEMVIEKARRLVEVGEDVIILLDSITRLARAYNTTMPSSGKILSGGVEASALQKPKRFFGSARNIEGGGSLTILGTALVDTGSKMDEVIFEEFKGTGNMELHLDRDLSNKRVFPALSFEKSGTRKEELLYHPDEMEKVHALRRAMKGVPSTEAMEMLIQRVKRSKTNAQFLMSMAR